MQPWRRNEPHAGARNRKQHRNIKWEQIVGRQVNAGVQSGNQHIHTKWIRRNRAKQREFAGKQEDEPYPTQTTPTIWQ